MNIGYLNFDKPELDKFTYNMDIQTKLFLQYSELVENHELGKKLLLQLESDPRAVALNGHMISAGNGAVRFDSKLLTMWQLWARNEYGEEVTERNLNKFLDSESVPIINTLWIQGIEVDRTINLDCGVSIVPINEFQDCREKEQYLRHDLNINLHRTLKPKVAITIKSSVKKVWDNINLENFDCINKEFSDSSALLYDITLLLNVLEGITCTPYFATSYVLPEMPLGMFTGSSGSAPIYDVPNNQLSKVDYSKSKELNELLKSFKKLCPDKKKLISRIIDRLSQAKRRDKIEDKILDLGIALEMALLDDNDKEQLSLSFRLRGSWLVAENFEQRKIIYQKLKDIYKYRCQAAHQGSISAKESEKVINCFSDYTNLTEKIICERIYKSDFDWLDLTLGNGWQS